MPRTIRTAAAAALLVILASPTSAQQLENSQTPATSGTTGHGQQGRLSGANQSAGDRGPASETTMDPSPPATGGTGQGGVQAGGADATKELYQH